MLWLKCLKIKIRCWLIKCYIKVERNNEKEVIIGLRKVIDDKEKMINNLYKDDAQLNIKYWIWRRN